MKTTVEILAGQLGSVLGRMTKLADQGKEAEALALIPQAWTLLADVRRAGGARELAPGMMAPLERTWKKMIRDRVQAAQRTA